jgi:hypothetical protein
MINACTVQVLMVLNLQASRQKNIHISAGWMTLCEMHVVRSIERLGDRK